MYPAAVLRDHIPHLIISFLLTVAHSIYLIGSVSFIPSDKPLAAGSHSMKMQTRSTDSMVICSVDGLNRSLLEYLYIGAVFFVTLSFTVGYHVLIFIACLRNNAVSYYPEFTIIPISLYDFVIGIDCPIFVGILHTKPQSAVPVHDVIFIVAIVIFTFVVKSKMTMLVIYKLIIICFIEVKHTARVCALTLYISKPVEAVILYVFYSIVTF